MRYRLLVLDVDGVLTDGRLYYGAGPEPLRAFHTQDGLAIRWFQKLGGIVAFLTAKTSEAVRQRAADLCVEHVIQGSDDKLADLERLAQKLELALSSVAMMGDDLPDLAAMRSCGMAIAPANASAPVRAIAAHVTRAAGGGGAVREGIEILLTESGQWQEVLRAVHAPTGRAKL